VSGSADAHPAGGRGEAEPEANGVLVTVYDAEPAKPPPARLDRPARRPARRLRAAPWDRVLAVVYACRNGLVT
jgi:hypothetical protein